MGRFPKKLAPIRGVILSLLRSRDHLGRLYSSSDIASILGIASGVDTIDSRLVRRAFQFDGQTKYCIPLSSLGYKGRERWLFYRAFDRADPNDAIVTGIGCFASESAGRDVSLSRWNVGLDAEQCSDIVQYCASEQERSISEGNKKKRPRTTVVSPSPLKISLKYIWRGQAGEISFLSGASISAGDIERGILQDHLSDEAISKDNAENRNATRYTQMRINRVDVWLPTGVSAVMTSYLSLVKSSHDKVKRISTEVFGKKNDCRFRSSEYRWLRRVISNSAGLRI